MELLQSLKFVQGAIARKDFVPEWTHFRIKDRRITGYNGRMSISAPIALDIDCCPKALPLVKAIETCEEAAQLHLTPAGKLAIRSGNFRTHVETVTDTFTGLEPQGIDVKPDGRLLPILRTLYEITAEDATRQWANGVLLDGQSAYATNNVVLAQFWLGYYFPYRVNLPAFAIKELMRVNEEPERIQMTADTATFYFSEERWLKTQLFSTEWPDMEKAFGRADYSDVPEVPATLFECLERIKPFVDDLGRVYVSDGLISTVAGEEGTTLQVPGMRGTGIFNIDMLRLLDGIATHAKFEAYPNAVPFVRNNVRGIIVGMRT
jgi:DNA polymerase III sliding clamp (beta) subunit (PCNA family)